MTRVMLGLICNDGPEKDAHTNRAGKACPLCEAPWREMGDVEKIWPMRDYGNIRRSMLRHVAS